MRNVRHTSLPALIIVFALGLVTSGMAQESADALFRRAEAAMNARHYESAYTMYSEYVTAYPNGPGLPRALWMLGRQAQRSQGDNDSAIMYFQRIIDGDFDIRTQWYYEPPVMYKHIASTSIASIYIHTHRCAKALPYLALADTVYRVSSEWSDSAIASMTVTRLYSLYYEGLGEIDKAITTLAPIAYYTGDVVGMFTELFDRLDSLVHLRYTDDEILKILVEAEKNIRILRRETLEWNSDSTKILWAVTYVEGHINIFGADVPIDGENPRSTYRESPNRLSDEEWQAHFRDYMRSGYLYKLVHKK